MKLISYLFLVSRHQFSRTLKSKPFKGSLEAAQKCERRKFLFNLNAEGKTLSHCVELWFFFRWQSSEREGRGKKTQSQKWWGNFGFLKFETFLLPKTTLFNANRLQILIWNFSQRNIKTELRWTLLIFNLDGEYNFFFILRGVERVSEGPCGKKASNCDGLFEVLYTFRVQRQITRFTARNCWAVDF